VTCKNIYQDPVMQRVMANSGQQSSMSHSYGTTVIMHSVSLIGICHELGAAEFNVPLLRHYGNHAFCVIDRNMSRDSHTCMRLRSLQAADVLISLIWLYGHSVFCVIHRNESQKETNHVTHMHATHDMQQSCMSHSFGSLR